MKKQITFLFFTLLFALTSSQVMAQKNVLYINQDGVEAPDGSGASEAGNDPVIRMLKSDSNFTVSYVEINQAFEVTKVGENNVGSNVVGQPVDFTDFDLIIGSDTMASSNAIFQDGNPLHIDELTVPVIYSKAFAFRGGDAVLTTNGSAVTQTQNLSVEVLNTSNDMFSGIDFSGGSEIQLFRTTSDDNGSQAGIKAIDVLNGLDNSASGTLLATVEQVTSGEEDKAAVINYIPSGSTLGASSEATSQDIVIFGFSYGATVKKDGGNVTSEYLTIWRNAAYKLTGQTPPATLYVNPDYGKYEIVTETVVYDFRDGSIIPNPSDGYVIQGSPEAEAQPQTDRFKTADGVVDYRHAAGDNFHSSTYGLDMKVGSRVNFKPLNTGSSVIKVPLSEFSSLDFQLKLANNNNKAFIKVNGVSTSSPSSTTYDEILDATATAGQDLNEFITIEYYPKGGQALEFYADATNGGSDIYLPYIEVTYSTLRKIPAKILYLTNANSSDEGGAASVPGNDAITRMLNADENFEVTAGTIDGSGTITPADLSPYSLIIIQEDVQSGSSAFKSSVDGALAPRNLTVPVIYCKSEAFRVDKAVIATAAGIESNKSNVSVTVPEANQSNPMFSGIDFSGGDEIRLFSGATNGSGSSAGDTAIKVLTGLEMDNAAAATLVTTPEVTDVNSSIVINYIPTGTKLGTNDSDVTAKDIVVFAFAYGAQVKGDGSNISPEALTIWRNAVYQLSGLDVPTTLVENPDFFIAKNVLYLNKVGKTPGEGASDFSNDPIIRMLSADEKFNVTYFEAMADGTDVPDLANYDLVIAQETFDSGDGIFKPGGVLGVKDVSIPVIYNKTWAFRNDRAVTDADAGVTATQNLSVTATNTNHPLFRGIDFSESNEVRIFKEATANDNGSVGGNKAIDVLNDLDISSAAGATIATVPEVTDANKAFVVNYLPEGTQLGENAEDKLKVKAVALSFSYGASILGDGANISPQALTIWRNAAYMLTFGPAEVPTTLVENPDFTLSIDKPGEVSDVSSHVRAIKNRVYISDVKMATEVNIYSITGALVKTIKTNNDLDFEFRSGLYIATVKTLEGTKSVKFIVSH